MAEFLPLCDVLFNVISLAGYFCDVVFDVVMGYALLEKGYKGTFAATMSIIITSLVITQVLSLRWYLHVCWSETGKQGSKGRSSLWPLVVLHCLQLGVLWRYARLLLPVRLAHVKHQVRDLCMLRLVHAFCEAAPMLLLQLHVLYRESHEQSELNEPTEPNTIEPTANKAFSDLNVISASLSLFSVCWALASFSKNVRRQNVHRLVLTWLGVIFQFLWRLGTVSARVCALTVYALVYEYWVFLVIGLHWLTMFLWLLSPKSVFHGERLRRRRKVALSALIAFVYVFAYVNLHDYSPKQKMVTFYVVMVVENWVLVWAWWRGSAAPQATLPAAVAASFLAGLACMLLYYRYFHVRRLGYLLGDNQQGTNSTNASSSDKKGKQSMQTDNAAIPGVFNCRFANPVNGGACRKKKKPTSFVPPPVPAPTQAFWRRPLPATYNPQGGSSENEGSSVGSRVNIHLKLQEKKQKQLAELRAIEEEIKQGKIIKTTPVAAEEIYSSLQRQPIPRSKTHAETPSWPNAETAHSYQNYPIVHNCNVYPTYSEIKPTYEVTYQKPQPQAEINEPPKIRRLYELDGARPFYETPSVTHNENTRSPIRTSNYLVSENSRHSPRNIINNSPRNYMPDLTANSFEPSIEKPRITPTNYTENHRQNLGEFSGYSESNSQDAYKFENKDDYASSTLHNALNSVQSIENLRNDFSENCGRFGPNCERLFQYPSGSKKMEQLRKMQRCRTPEILLAPHYLEGCNRQVCCHWDGPGYKKKEDGACSSGEESTPDANNRETPRPASDIDSQISLPRSYTLPREFRYWRRRPRLANTRAPSNNSSDGDVDSADEADSCRRSNCSGRSQNKTEAFQYQHRHEMPQREQYSDLYSDRRKRANFRKQPKPETKL